MYENAWMGKSGFGLGVAVYLCSVSGALYADAGESFLEFGTCAVDVLACALFNRAWIWWTCP